MTRIEETRLPGVGMLHSFVTKPGRRVGVLAHHSGYRELLVYDEQDPDACRISIRLDEDDSHTLAELLGAAQFAAHIAELQQSAEGLTIDWLPVQHSSACAGQEIGRTRLRERTGVSIVAVVRGEQTVPAPGPEFRLEAGDTAVVVGTGEGIQRAVELLQGP
jgi:TrkA domain protein